MSAALIEQALALLAAEVPEREVLASPDAVRNYLRLWLGRRPHEVFAVVFLDARNRVIEIAELFRGTLTQTAVYPREVVRRAIELNAAAVVFAHNHPSGDPTPSPEDVRVTREMVKAGKLLSIDVLDHIVIGRQRFVSLKERGLGFDN